MYEGFRVNDTGAPTFVVPFQGQKLFALLWVFLLNILIRRTTLPPATRTPSSIHTALLRLHHKARPGKRRINLKLVQFVGFETGDSSTLKVAERVGEDIPGSYEVLWLEL